MGVEGGIAGVDGHAVVLLVECPERGAELAHQVLGGGDAEADADGVRGRGEEAQDDAVMDLEEEAAGARWVPRKGRMTWGDAP